MATGLPESEWIEIEVINWERYNPRNDRKSHSWFRLENTIVTEPKFYGLSAAQRFIVVALFAEANKGGRGRARIFLPWLCDSIKVTMQEVLDTVHVMVSRGVLKDLGGNHPGTSGDQSVTSGCPTDVRTNARDERTLPDKTKNLNPTQLINKGEEQRVVDKSVKSSEKTAADEGGAALSDQVTEIIDNLIKKKRYAQVLKLIASHAGLRSRYRWFLEEHEAKGSALQEGSA